MPFRFLTNQTPLKNQFGVSEFRGAIGDLGTTLPLAFLLIMSNGFPAARIFFLWGLAYIAVGIYYKVPISIQPLKAMAVIAVTSGFSASMLSSAAVLYGILLLVLSTTGLIKWIQQWFSQGLIRGVQLGIGLLLAAKAWDLISGQTLYLNGTGEIGIWILILAGGILLVLMLSRWLLKRSVALEIIVISLVISLLFGVPFVVEEAGGSAWLWSLPDWSGWWNLIVLLIIPQLPLTLGNAVYAADDAAHKFWPKQSERVTPTRLAGSIGLFNIIIGLLGGFPICHGAGGIAAHHRFSGKTGGTVIILGSVFVLLALTQTFNTLLFLIPIPVLGVLLLFDSWQMMVLMRYLPERSQIIIALLVGLTSFITHNLSIALLAGFVMERLLATSFFKQQLQKLI